VENPGTDQTVCIGSLGDIVGRICPIQIPKDYFASEFFSLIQEAMTDQFGLKTLNQPPDTIPGPITVNEDGTEDLIAPSMARLNFNVGENEESQPVIALLPTCLPLPVGVHFPKDGVPIDEQNLEVNAHYPFFSIWQQGIKYSLNQNEGKSVTEGGSLFDIGSINKQLFQTRTITNEVRAVITPLLPGTVLYSKVEASIQTLERSVWIRLSENLPIDAATEGVPANPSNQSTGGDLGTAQAIQEMVANFYMIMNLLIYRFSDSELWKSISEHEKAIKSDAGRQFFRRFDLEKQIHLNVIGDIQDILSAFTVLGTHAQLRDAVAAGTAIDPATLEEPINHSCLVTTNCNTLLKRGSPSGLDHIPVFADIFPQLELNKSKKDGATNQENKKQANKEKTTPDQQKGRDSVKMQ
jgi:hypothetical protein